MKSKLMELVILLCVFGVISVTALTSFSKLLFSINTKIAHINMDRMEVYQEYYLD